MIRMGYSDKKEKLSIYLSLLFDASMLGGMFTATVNLQYFFIFLAIIIPVWIILIIYYLYDWFKIAWEAREKDRLIITSGNEDFEEEEEYLFNGIGIEKNGIEEIQIEPWAIERALNSKELREKIFEGIPKKLKESFKEEFLELKNVLSNIPKSKETEYSKKKKELDEKKKKDDDDQVTSTGQSSTGPLTDQQIIDQLDQVPDKILTLRDDANIDVEIDLTSNLEEDELKYKLKFEEDKVNFENFDIEKFNIDKGQFPYFYKKEINFFKNEHSIKTFGDLLKQDLAELGLKLNQKFRKLRPGKINLKKIVQEAKSSVMDFIGEYMKNLSNDGRLDFIKLRETPLFMLYYRYHIYKFTFDRKIPVVVQETENEKEILWTNQTYVILPQEIEKSLFFTTRKIPFKGYWIKCPHVAKLEWVFRDLLLGTLPIHFVNSCYYTRKRIQKDLTIDNDKILLAMIAILTKVLQNEKKQRKTTNIIRENVENELKVYEEKEEYRLGLKYANEDADEEERKLKVDWRPTKTIKGLKWVIVAMVALMFVFGGILGYLIAWNNYQSLINEYNPDIITGGIIQLLKSNWWIECLVKYGNPILNLNLL